MKKYLDLEHFLENGIKTLTYMGKFTSSDFPLYSTDLTRNDLYAINGMINQINEGNYEETIKRLRTMNISFELNVGKKITVMQFPYTPKWPQPINFNITDVIFDDQTCSNWNLVIEVSEDGQFEAYSWFVADPRNKEVYKIVKKYEKLYKIKNNTPTYELEEPINCSNYYIDYCLAKMVITFPETLTLAENWVKAKFPEIETKFVMHCGVYVLTINRSKDYLSEYILYKIAHELSNFTGWEDNEGEIDSIIRNENGKFIAPYDDFGYHIDKENPLFLYQNSVAFKF